MEPTARLFLRAILPRSDLSPLTSLLSRHFSSSSSSSPASDEFVSFFSCGGGVGESSVYRQHLQCHRPPTVSHKRLRWNSCSFIGTVAYPVARCDSENGRVGVYTSIHVKTPARGSRANCSPFRILVSMWDKLAEISAKHLKPDDLIYVWGDLRSFQKIDESGMHRLFYGVNVKDLNYVRVADQNQPSQNHDLGEEVDKEDDTVVPYCELDLEKRNRERLHLWQVFFANPYEWWDNRQRKSARPHFVHKDTHECLSLSPKDPPWVKKQLVLYDLEMTERARESRCPTRAFQWKFDD